MDATSRGMTFSVKPSVNPVPDKEREAALENLSFGALFSDHMVVIRWSADGGWHSPEVTARSPFSIDPACGVLHYAQEIFEGMKAYRTPEGEIALFRPEENARRFNESARRMAMPELPEKEFVKAVEELIRIDAKWIPRGDGSLYLRPFMFASEAFLGVRPSREYIFCIIAAPVGPYFKRGNSGAKIWVSQDFSRAARGGTGAAKCGGNYAGGLIAQAESADNGCDQVVFLDAVEQRWVEELSGMNVFFVMKDNTIITPPLSGTILPGITRKSLIELAREHGFTVREEPYSFESWKADAASGQLKEAFACGTAAVLFAIGSVKYVGGEFTIGDGETGSATTMLRENLVGIQKGLNGQPHKWRHLISQAGG